MRDDAQEIWQQLERVLDTALDTPPEERAAFLDRACIADPILRAEAERLLDACDDAQGFLEEPAPLFAASLLDAPTPETVDPSCVDARVGPYRLVRELGHGGMGAVYLAERADHQFRHRVALKVIRRGLDDRAILRFMEERQILASLNHAGIARLLDGGLTGDRLPYFAMEYIEGTRIDRYCDTRRLSVPERLELFERVCHAVQYAHHNLVVHRDLKPSNILVTDDGQVKLLDFGIAKLLGTRDMADTLTETGIRLMTPQYASPEQVRGDPLSTVSDVYALGVILYELLTGHNPYGCSSRGYDIERAVLSDEPMRPSVIVRQVTNHDAPANLVKPASVSEVRNCRVDKLQRALRGDLDTIIMRAMAKQPERRYATAEQLAADINRYLTGQPVMARRDTRRYRAQKFIRRHPFSVAATAAFVALLVMFSALTTLQAVRIDAQAERLRIERDKAQQVTSFLTEMFNLSSPVEGKGNALRAQEVLDTAATRIERELGNQPDVQAQLLKTVGRAYYGLGLYGQARRLLTSALQLFERVHPGDDPDVSSTLNVLALVLLDDGDYQAAERMYRRTLAMRRRMLGEQHANVARTLNGLGLVLRVNGDHAAAAAALREALAIDRRPPENHVGVSQTLNNLGLLMQDTGDIAAAESLHREALALRRRLFGNEHLEVSVSQVNLAIALRTQGNLTGAETLLRQALEIQRQVLGDEHADLAASISELAEVLLLKRDAIAAERLYRESLERYRRALGDSHPRLIGTLIGLGSLLVDRNDAPSGEPLLRNALAISKKTFGGDHWRIAQAEAALGSALSSLGDEKEGERLLVRGYTGLDRTRGAKDRRTRSALQSLIAHHQRWGDIATAKMLRASLDSPRALR